MDKKNLKMFPKFSVSMCVYSGDNSEWFREALESVIDQTVRPNEIVLIVDGPIPIATQEIIKKYEIMCKELLGFKVIYLKENQGHGNARRCGLNYCTNEIVALMDADDICINDRFERQLEVLSENDIDIIGGNIQEFIGDKRNIVAKRIVPMSNEDIKEYLKYRCPFNQMTVMFKKKSVLDSGGYLDWFCNEDYYLWLRMYLNGCTFANTGTTLVNVRVGEDMYKRRGGYKYFKSEFDLQTFMLKNNIIGYSTYFMNCLKRLIVQVLLPNSVRGWVFRKFARE